MNYSNGFKQNPLYLERLASGNKKVGWGHERYLKNKKIVLKYSNV